MRWWKAAPSKSQRRLTFSVASPCISATSARTLPLLRIRDRITARTVCKSVTDPLAVEIAGHYLKTALESGEGVGREMYALTVEETLRHLEAAVAELETEAAVKAKQRLGIR